ncbi:MAG: universal stress protein [Pseudomonadota bacterium]|nr:universal stress protein [Pseudomonadota bacterium]
MSSIRSILVHLDAAAGSTARLTLAHRLADRFGAGVTALFGVHPDPTRAAFAYSAGAAARYADEVDWPGEQVRARLRDQCAEHEPASLWCEVVGDSVRHGFVAEAAYADLLVLGQQATADEPGAAPPGFVETVILESGTPAIVVPHPHRQASLGDCVLVAWNGSAPAARAMKAALPLMRNASQVHVATWSRQPAVAPFSRLDVQAWLHRHGIAAQIHRRDPTAHVADELLLVAAELHADLVVMGCYGHSRIREQLFGGVTRASLATLPVPVLMAH